MNKNSIWFVCSIVVTICVIVLLVTGSPLLTMALNEAGSIPLGTFITWAGMLALPLAIYWGISSLRTPVELWDKILSIALKIILILAILWVPLSYLLAGNLSFSFSEKASFQGGQTAMLWFWRLSYGIAVGSVLILIIHWITLLFKRKSET